MKILIAIDEQAVGEELADYVCAHRWKPGSEFIILNVVDNMVPGTYAGIMPPSLVEEMSKEIWARGESLVRKTALKIRDRFHSPRVSELVLQGAPAEIIISTAKDAGIDLILMGSHRRAGINRLIIGSVSNRVTAHANCSVVVLCPALLKAGDHIEPAESARA